MSVCVFVGCHSAPSLVCLSAGAPDLCGHLSGLLNLAAIQILFRQATQGEEKKPPKDCYLIERQK